MSASIKPCACCHWPPCKKHLLYPHSRNRYSHPRTSNHSTSSRPGRHTDVLRWHSYLPSGSTVLPKIVRKYGSFFINIIFALTYVNVHNYCIVILPAALKSAIVLGNWRSAKVSNKLYSDDSQALVVSDPLTVLWDGSDRPPPWSSQHLSFFWSEWGSRFVHIKKWKMSHYQLFRVLNLVLSTIFNTLWFCLAFLCQQCNNWNKVSASQPYSQLLWFIHWVSCLSHPRPSGKLQVLW